MCEARVSRTLTGVAIWTILSSLVFGFCATWCLHFIGMLSCEFEVHIGLNALLTILSAVLAVSFTFGTLSMELIRKPYCRTRRKKDATKRRQSTLVACPHLASDAEFRQSSELLLRPSDEIHGARTWNRGAHLPANGSLQSTDVNQSQPGPSTMGALLSKDTTSSPIFMNKGSHLNGKMKQPVMLPFQSTTHGDYAIADADADTSDYDDMHSFRLIRQVSPSLSSRPPTQS
jgi:hypothetical protein